MKETPIRAVEMVRAIRDEINEETKALSREELKAFFAREAAAMRKDKLDNLTRRDCLVGDPEDLVHMDWSQEWRS